MNTLPPELHAYICEFACTDDGETMRTLRGLSRYFQEVAKPYLYRTISVFDEKQVAGLLERLESTPPHLRHIKNLFLANPTARSPSNQVDSQKLMRIITLAAPTLQTLSFVVHTHLASTSMIARLFRTSFPNLLTLTVSGFYPFPSSVGKFPRLQSLHLLGNRNPHGLFQMPTLEDACPALTHLRISGLGAAGLFVYELEEALRAEATEEEDECPIPSRVPPSVQRITVQAGPEPSADTGSSVTSTTILKDRFMMAQLQMLKTRKVPDGSDVLLRVRDRTLAPISVDDLRTDWLDNLL
ncbi:hypothetical protein NLJ89_g564 [Agrocybe chaxingu]|uniref:F-box domain-containing protein n=1 Tax=Agrocybe chaxingu TaxID=84603 RepID=A0A9W8N1S8_9AGAR|nr:hypothetical protein NLJ89_g564 [Agrocybe chaxingu]